MEEFHSGDGSQIIGARGWDKERLAALSQRSLRAARRAYCRRGLTSMRALRMRRKSSTCGRPARLFLVAK